MLYFTKQGSTSNVRKTFCQVQNKKILYSNFHALPIMPTSSYGILISFCYEESKQNERNEEMKEWNASGSRKDRGNEKRTMVTNYASNNGTTLANFLMP